MPLHLLCFSCIFYLSTIWHIFPPPILFPPYHTLLKVVLIYFFPHFSLFPSPFSSISVHLSLWGQQEEAATYGPLINRYESLNQSERRGDKRYWDAICHVHWHYLLSRHGRTLCIVWFSTMLHLSIGLQLLYGVSDSIHKLWENNIGRFGPMWTELL